MALDPNDPNRDESQYSALLAQPAHHVGHLGFVSSQQYYNANKDAVDRQRDTFNTQLQQGAAGLQGDLQKTQADIAGAAKPGIVDANGQTIAADSTQAQQMAALGNISTTSRADAEKYANSTYGGPNQAQVDSRYAPLLARAQQLQEKAQGGAGTNAFDRQMLGTAGGVNTNAANGIDTQFNNAYAASSTAAKKAEADTAANASKWKSLLGQYDANTATQKTADDANAAAKEKSHWRDTMAKVTLWSGGTPDAAYDGHRPSGQELITSLNAPSRANTPGHAAAPGLLDALMVPPEGRERMAQVLDRLSPQELDGLMSQDPRKDPQGFANKFRGLANQHGLGWDTNQYRGLGL